MVFLGYLTLSHKNKMNKKNITEQIQTLVNQFNAKNFNYIISKGEILIKKNPNYVILYNLVGSAYQNTGDFIKAKNNFINGLKLDPNNIALMNNLGMAYKNLLNYELAEELYLKILSTNDKYVNAYINLGNLKRDLNKFSTAIDLYKRALKLNHKNPTTNYLLALAYQGIGDFEKTVFYSNETLKYDFNFTRADHLLSQTNNYKDKDKDDHYQQIKKKIKDSNFENLEKIDLYFSLAKAEEDLNNIKESSENLIKGNHLKKKVLNYNLSIDISLLKEIKDRFCKIEPAVSEIGHSDNIIFILGMPRSGTSLVEQIVTSHRDVFGAGELPILSNIIKNNFIKDDLSIEDDFEKKIQDPLTINRLKIEYQNFIKNFNYKEKYITDKAPLNFRWIGFIKFIFPNSKIIHCLRDPKDNCLSMFKNLFEGGLNFTYDQNDLVRFYKQYFTLMDFWKSKFPGFIFDVKYENLVSNNQEEIKKIIEFCNLEWDENCLNFHKNKTPIKTMSTAQARKPIYKSSVKSFDKFKKFLPIIDKGL